MAVIDGVKAKISELQPSLPRGVVFVFPRGVVFVFPRGVVFVHGYDGSGLIDAAIEPCAQN